MALSEWHSNVRCRYKKEPIDKKEPSTMDIITLGIDIAKSVFHLHHIDADSAAVVQ